MQHSCALCLTKSLVNQNEIRLAVGTWWLLNPISVSHCISLFRGILTVAVCEEKKNVCVHFNIFQPDQLLYYSKGVVWALRVFFWGGGGVGRRGGLLNYLDL